MWRTRFRILAVKGRWGDSCGRVRWESCPYAGGVQNLMVWKREDNAEVCSLVFQRSPLPGTREDRQHYSLAYPHRKAGAGHGRGQQRVVWDGPK